MYEEFFGLKEMPFSVMPDPRFAYRSLGHKLAEGKIRFAADNNGGLAVLTGPVGCGKTTIANMLVAHWGNDAGKSVANLPVADDRGRAAFIKRVMDGFGVEAKGRSYADQRSHLERFLLDEHKAGRHAILVIDEVQRIHPDNIDTLTDLTNFQTSNHKFLTIILFGQDNFANKLRLKEAFRNRIAFIGHLDPLSFEDMIGMIGHRLTIAGAKLKNKKINGEMLPDLSGYLTEEALVEAYKITKGVPRDVCILLTNAFLNGFIMDKRPLELSEICATLKEMERLKKWPVDLLEEKQATPVRQRKVKADD